MVLRSVFLYGMAAVCFAAQTASVERWHNLVLDVSTPADAARELGKAVADKPERMTVYPVDKWFSSELKQKALRRMTFKVDGFKEANLFFREEKLVGIVLTLQKPIDPSGLGNLYGKDFKPYFSALAEGLGGVGRRGFREDVVRYPSFYNLIAEGDRSIVNAFVKNSGLKASLGGAQTAGNGFPGQVISLQLVSRALENRGGRGADLLK